MPPTDDAHTDDPNISESTVATARLPRRQIGVLLLIAAPTFWLLHLLVSYALVPVSCRIGSDVPLYAVTVAVAIAAAITTFTAVRAAGSRGSGAWRALLFEGSWPRERDDRRTLFVLAACLAAYFSFLVLMMALVAPIVDRCA